MNTCPHCNKAIEEEPSGYTLVSVDSKAQKVVDVTNLAPKIYRSKHTGARAEIIPVVCIMERET